MTNDSGGYLVTKKYSYYVFVLLFLLYMFNYMDRMVVVSIFPFLHDDWGVSDTKCGLLVSAAYWAILIFSLPFSVLIDRWSRRKTISIMAIMWSLATAACGFTKSFSQLFTTRAMIGIGEAGFAPGGTAMISAVFPENKRAAIMGIWNASIPLGSALGIALGAVIAEHFGWRYAFWMVALPGIFVGMIFYTIKDYKTVDLTKTERTNDSQDISKQMKLKDILFQFTRTRSLVLTYLAFAACLFVTTSLMSWLPTYLHRMEDLSMSQAGIKSGIVMMLAIVGAPLGGYLADKWRTTRVNARLVFCAASSLVSSVIFFVAFSFLSGTPQYILMLFGGIAIVAFVPAGAAVTQDVVHPGLRAISYSICVVVQHILGSSTGPIVIGAISDAYDIQTAMLILPGFTVIAAVLFMLGSLYYEKDLAAVEKVTLSVEE
ncbi:MAG TPA: MFS transporter [Deltaproteobacteria bacterium]|nr:MFS transporter [Deltaproteobacteria bacterium]HPR51799.1 MFS transporter [Deltaproteobacteria bacterium]